ncbi:MAG: hypothetical protein IKV54_04310 [Clostridia bacterium]|nr:hypothetical protein [Clostridia bacterium]
MKKAITISLLICLLCSTFMCWGCGDADADGSDTTAAAETTAPADTPEKTSPHEITVSEVESILVANGLRTNQSSMWLDDGASYHGGQQMRVCHTDRGTYTAFCVDFGGDRTGSIQKFYVTKIDLDRKVSIVYYGEFGSDGNEVLVNIAQDTNGDIIVSATSPYHLGIYVIDKENDEAKEYVAWPEFTGYKNGYNSNGYSQTMFDFENRKIYAFFNGGREGRYCFEWFIFDLEEMSWSNGTDTPEGGSHMSYFANLEGVGRHCYLYPFPDGNGGAYIVSERDIYSDDCKYVEKDMEPIEDWGSSKFLWDQLDLFHIPDLTSTENITIETVHRAYVEGGKDGIWSTIANANQGDVFVDSNGYMHITYMYTLFRFLGSDPEFDPKTHYRHAIYDGTECIFNEELTLPEKGSTSYRPMVRQSPDGKLHLVVAKMNGEGAGIYFYSTDDELGRSWKFEKSAEFGDGLTASSLTVSAVRDGSVQDGILSAFFYGNSRAHTFDISLEDYTITPIIDILKDYDLKVDWRFDERVPYIDHTTQIITTDNGIYAAFVFDSSLSGRRDNFHIVKIDNDGNVTVLATDSYSSEQNKYLTMGQGADGKIYVGIPDGMHAYVVDTETDTATLCELTPIITKQLVPRQVSVIHDSVSGNEYFVSVLENGAFGVSSNVMNTEKYTVSLKNAVRYTVDRELSGVYDDVYTLSDGKGGVYMVGTRKITEEELGGKLEYNGYTKYLRDSVVLLHIPGLTEGTEAKTVDVHLPYEDEGDEGIWSAVDVKDVYLDGDGKLNIVYSDYYFDYDDNDRPGNPRRIKDTLKYYLAVYDGLELVSKEELNIAGLTENSAVRMTETADGTLYLITCDREDIDLIRRNFRQPAGEAELVIYSEVDGEWISCAESKLGDFYIDGLLVSAPAGDDEINCLVYATDNDVYRVSIAFEAKE